jgi:amidohydrolase
VEGTFRTFDEKWRNEAHIHITEIATKTAESMGGSCEVFIDKGYPFLVNDEILTKEITAYSQEYLGKEKVDKLELRATAEDFAYYSQQVPAVFFRLGVKPINSDTISNLHTSTFTVDESSIKTGMGLMAWIAMQCLYNK